MQNASSNTALTFHDTQLNPIYRDGQPWLTAAEISAALGYARADKISLIYHRHRDEFAAGMSDTLRLRVSGNLETEVRVFSPRGCYAIAMFARTPLAKEFRRWVLDVLESINRTGHYTHNPACSDTLSPALTTALHQRAHSLTLAGYLRTCETLTHLVRQYQAAGWDEPRILDQLNQHGGAIGDLQLVQTADLHHLTTTLRQIHTLTTTTTQNAINHLEHPTGAPQSIVRKN